MRWVLSDKQSNFLGLVMHGYYDILQSREKKYTSQAPFLPSILRNYPFDSVAEASYDTAYPHGKSLLGKAEPN